MCTHTHTHRKREIYFKELIHITVGLSKGRSAGWRPREELMMQS